MDVQAEHGHTRIAHPILEGLALAGFSRAQIKVLLVVVRSTYGWNRKSAEMSYTDLIEATDLSRSTVSDAVNALVEAGVLLQLQAPGFRSKGRYGLQKDPTRWGPFSCSPASLGVRSAEQSGQPNSTGQPDGSVRSAEQNSTGQPNTEPLKTVEPQGGSNPLKKGKKGKTRDTSKNGPVSELWSVFLEELGGDGRQPSLTDSRRKRLAALYAEQLEGEDDPPEAFRWILRAVKASDHHMSTRAYQLPESLFRNAERRERWTLDGLALRNGKGHDDDPLRMTAAELRERERRADG